MAFGPSHKREWVRWSACLSIFAASGALVVISPVAALVVLATALALVLLIDNRRTKLLFFWALGLLLVGYAFAGKGFAHLGVAPLYLGEVTLLLGVFAFIGAERVRNFGATQLLVVAFMLWGFARTAPYVAIYGVDALRDAVVWGYAAFALIVSLITTQRHVEALLRIYRRLLALFVPWVALFAAVWLSVPGIFPLVPGTTDVPIPYFKAGDMAVHLAGAGAFILVGLYGRTDFRRYTEPIVWIFWFAGFAVTAALNRGGMLAVATATPLVLLFVRSFNRVAAGAITSILLLALMVTIGVEVRGGTRVISVDQLAANVSSVFGDPDTLSHTSGGLVGTRRWRELWWNLIIEDTVYGPHFWGGRGFGVDIATEDGFSSEETDTRAPHNAHIGILARSGVPGLTLWLAVQVSFAATMIRASRVAARTRRPIWLAATTWILAYWLAALVNMSFDAYLEGPQGGILFWSLMGFGLAAAAIVTNQPGKVGGLTATRTQSFVR